jgi:diguanylate cyclase (GGDEF)-like protein
MSLTRPPVAVRAAIVACVGLWLLYVLSLAFASGGAAANAFENGAYEVLLVAGGLICAARAIRVHEERLPWSLFAGALLVWAAADLYDLAATPTSYPSIADAGWLLFYPLIYTALWLLARARLRMTDAGMYLDGVLGGLALAAVASALVFEPIADAGVGDAAAVATNLAYPLGDLLMLVLVVGAIGLTGWRPGRSWILLAAGLLVAAAADTWYLYLVATGAYHDRSLIDALWPASMLLVAWASWQPTPEAPTVRFEGWRVLALPTLFMLSALVVEMWDHFRRVSEVAIWLATAAIVLGIVRMGLIFRENLRILARTRLEATTDVLTGLCNRRALLTDLDVELEAASAASPRVLALFDLDGFKSYNDSFGHAAGDELLARLGRRLSAAMVGHGGAYRLGGDEFCVLARTDVDGPAALLATAAAALREGGEGFAIASSYGAVLLPEEAADASAALLLADRRMYAAKHGGRDPAGRQTRDVLVTTLREREPDLHEHIEGVAKLALAVAERFGMSIEERYDVARAAELHDIGKIAIPDAILSKPSKLDEAEWDFMRRHTVIGERILASAPAMRSVSKLVRSSHERWDGSGYPDRLAGEEIPLGARIVSVCDAYEAMVSDRPYRTGITPQDAIAELRRCAGSQFDPNVVEVFATLPDWALAPPQPLRLG